MTRRLCSITMSAAIGSLIAFAPHALAKTAASVTVAQEARETLTEMRGLARRVSTEAFQLHTYSLDSKLGPEDHRSQLGALKEDVNTMGKEIVDLQARRESLDPWEQQAVDKVLPLLKDAAANAQSATVYFNENGKHLWGADYRAYTENVYRDSDQIAHTLKDYLKFEKVREEEQHLETAIGGGSR